MSMASPVLHKMLFGDFREGAARRVALEDVDGSVFGDVLDRRRCLGSRRLPT